jgi:hypothetical protein
VGIVGREFVNIFVEGHAGSHGAILHQNAILHHFIVLHIL